MAQPQSALRALDQAYLMGIGQGPAPARVPRTRGQTAADMLGAAAIGTTPIPIVGDVVGVAADAAMYAADRKTRTLPNYAMSVLGMLPFVPGVAAVRAARDAASPLEGTLDMSQAARMQRKSEGKFVPTTGYHGTSVHKSEGQLFDEFQLFEGDDLTRSVSRSPVGKLGVSIAHQPEVASDFAYQASPADGEGATIMPLTFRSDKSGTINLSGDETNDEIFGTVVDAWKDGYDAIHFTNYTTPAGTKGSFTLIKDPAQVCSVNAAFDPAKRGSANLMASAAGATIGLSALRNIQRDEEPQPD